MEKSETYYPAFDYLRIILATTVALGHSGAAVWENAADLSVQIFFAMSGWLIGGILLRLKPDALPRFYFNRAARIWLPYFIAILLLVSASLLKERVSNKWLEILFYDATFVYNIFGPEQLAMYSSAMPLSGTGNHFWSICAEEQFYLLAPLLLVIAPAFGRAIWFWIIVSVLVMASPLSTNFGAISFGVLAAVSRVTLGDWHNRCQAKAILAGLATVTFFLIFFSVINYRIGAPVFSICLVMLLAHAGTHSDFAAFAGGISFPMYLNHWIGTFVAHAAFARFGLRDSLISHITGVIISIAIAIVLYLVVDRTIKINRSRYFTPGYGRFIIGLAFALVTIGLIGGFLWTGAISL
jgi:peptidoglycan/LPS O-acetylase OafA/YrhL